MKDLLAVVWRNQAGTTTYFVSLYRPRKVILAGTRRFPEAQPVS